MRPGRAAIPLLAVVALLVLPSVAHAAPRRGLWLGQRGKVSVSFTVNRRQGHLVLTNLVSFCEHEANDDVPDPVSPLSFSRHRIASDGRVPGLSGWSGHPVRLGRSSGTFTRRWEVRGGPGGPNCPMRAFRDIPVRHVAPRHVADGRWRGTAYAHSHPEFVVVSGGTAVHVDPELAAPDKRSEFFPTCSNGEAFSEWDDLPSARIQPDGSFRAPGAQMQGRFTGKTVSGSYTMTCPDGSTSTERFTGKLTSAAHDGAPYRRSGTPSPPPPKHPPGPPKRHRGCTGQVTVDPVEALSSCFRRHGGVWTSRTRVRANGIDLMPATKATRIRIDPRSGILSATGPVVARVGSIRLARIGDLRWAIRHPIAFKVESGEEDKTNRDDTFAGLRLKGTAELDFRPGVSRLTIGVELPKFLVPGRLDGLTATGVIQASNQGGLQAGGKLNTDALELGRVEVRDVALELTPTDTGALHFNGDGTVYLVPSRALAFKVGVGFGSDGWFRVAGGADGLNKPVGDGFFFQRVNLSVELHPFKLGGGAGGSFGPQIKLPGEGPEEAASVDGAFSYAAGPPWSFTLSGDAKIVEAKLAHAELTLKPGEVDAAGNIEFEWEGYGLDGSVSGWATLHALETDGSVRLALPGLDLRGDAVVSTVGIAACRHGAGPDAGFGYRWGGHVTIMSRVCGIGPWKASKTAAHTSAAGDRVRLPAGLRTATFAITGAAGAPRIVLTGPHGERVASPASPAAGIDNRRFVLFSDPARRTTYVAVAHPAAGVWRVAPQPGSTPITRVRSAQALPDVRVRARVSGRGRRRTLHWHARGLRGRRVRLIEAGRGIHRVLATTARARGKRRFHPAPGRAGRRRILAVVLQHGLEQRSSTAGRYRAPAPARPRAPRHVRIHRHRLAVTITWRGRRHGHYRVVARLSDGRRLLRLPNRRRVTIRPVLRSTRVRVTVRRYDQLGRLGHAAHADTRHHHRRRPHGPPPYVGLG